MENSPGSNHFIRLECEAVLFDLDGVLIDSAPCILRHWQVWAGQKGIDMGAILQVAHGRRTLETMRLVAPHLDVELEARLFAEREALDTDGVTVVSGAADLLNSLPGGTWAIATSGERPLATARLRRVGLPVPDVMVTAEDVVNGKPDPEPYLVAASRLGRPAEQCIVIEDAPAGLQAGRLAGMRTVAVAATHEPGELHMADLVAGRLQDIRVEVENGRLALHVACAVLGGRS